MDLMRETLLLTLATAVTLATSPSPASASSMLAVEDGGVYSRLTVKVSEEVPRQFCAQIMRNLQVRDFFLIEENFLGTFVVFFSLSLSLSLHRHISQIFLDLPTLEKKKFKQLGNNSDGQQQGNLP